MMTMQGSLHPPSLEMDPPALWDRMQLDEPTREQLNQGTNPRLLERLGMNDVHEPLLLQRLDMNETLGMNQLGMIPLDLRVKNRSKRNWTGMNNGTQKMSVSNTWTTLSRTSGEGRSQSSKPSHKSSQSWTSTPQGLRKRKMPLSNTIQEHLAKSKLSLLQRLNEVNTQPLDYKPMTKMYNELQGSKTMLLMNSSPRLVENQTNPSDISHQDEQIQTTTSENLLTKSAGSLSQKCPSSTVRKRLDKLGTKTVRNPAESLESLHAITKSSNNGFKTHERHHSDSPPPNGITSSRDKPLTSMQCSHHCIIYLLLKRTLDTWDQLKYPLDKQNQPRGSKRVANGQAPGTPPSKRLNSLSLTAKTNLENTGITLKGTSPLRSHPPIGESSFMTSQSATRSEGDKTPYSLIHTDSLASIQPLSCLMESNLSTPEPLQSGSPISPIKPRYATASTLSMDAGTAQTTAASNTLAKNANDLATEKNTVIAKRELAHELCPKYLRYNLWQEGSHFSHSSADWSKTALPLPSIPPSELANPIVTKTIKENPHLFDIITLIFIDRFENLLDSHPNQPFMKSVC